MSEQNASSFEDGRARLQNNEKSTFREGSTIMKVKEAGMDGIVLDDALSVPQDKVMIESKKIVPFFDPVVALHSQRLPLLEPEEGCQGSWLENKCSEYQSLS